MLKYTTIKIAKDILNFKLRNSSQRVRVKSAPACSLSCGRNGDSARYDPFIGANEGKAASFPPRGGEAVTF